MLNLSEITSYFKEVANSVKFQISSAITFGAALVLVWLKESNELKILLTVLFLFSLCMFTGSIIEKVVVYFQKKKKEKLKILQLKLGQLGEHHFTDILTTLWPDNNFNGLAWEIYVNSPYAAYLKDPCCLICKVNLVIRNNSKCDGFYLECPDCKIKFDVDDIGEKRSIANARLQGDVRKNPRKYFD